MIISVVFSSVLFNSVLFNYVLIILVVRLQRAFLLKVAFGKESPVLVLCVLADRRGRIEKSTYAM